MDLSPGQIHRFQKDILAWFAQNKRDLPWRHTRDPYDILVSEVMLQQTQVSRVLAKYQEWLALFPTVRDLAQAPQAIVLRAWSGLGYNRRALNLYKTAHMIMEKHQGYFPQSTAALKELPGIGDYTARAVACFAFDKQVAVVDTNVRKVILLTFFSHCHCEEEPACRQAGRRSNLSYQRDCHASLAMTGKKLQQIADQLLPRGHAYEWNQALMDYSAAVLAKERVPLPKQSKFIGSNRYWRGQILKQLLLYGATAKLVLYNQLGHENREQFEKILDELEQEGFIIQEEKLVRIA